MLVRHGNVWRVLRKLLPNNVMPRPEPTLILLCASCLVVRTANGQTPYAPAWNSTIVHVSDQPAGSNVPLVAQVVFVGVIENAARSANKISGLLTAHGITPRFEQRTILREDELVAQQQSGDTSRGTVWIIFPSPTSARLVFADHAHQRFLIRDIPLPEGLDDVARESIGQIVESSLGSRYRKGHHPADARHRDTRKWT